MERKTIWDRIAEEAKDISPKNVAAAIADYNKRVAKVEMRIKRNAGLAERYARTTRLS